MDAREVTGSTLSRINTLPPAEWREALLACCASDAWVDRIAAGRPYPDADALLRAAAQACHDLDDADLEQALAAHPRIGDRVAGAGAEARWSRQEQSSMSDADDLLRTEIVESNVAYEQRFGHVFLIRAAGRGPAEMLAELRRRLANDPRAEAGEVREQLGQIAQLRVEKLLEA